jgi:hypothetical protein
MAVTISPTSLTLANAASPATFTASTTGYLGRFTASSADQTKTRVAVFNGVGFTGQTKEGFGPTATFQVVWVATGGPTNVTVTDDAGNSANCAVTTS